MSKNSSLTEADLDQLKTICKDAVLSDNMSAAVAPLEEEIFGTGHSNVITELLRGPLQSILFEARDKPLLLFHAYGWMYGGIERGISIITDFLSQRNYRVVICTFEPVTNTGYKLGPLIDFMTIYGNSDRIRRLLTLIGLLEPDVFIGHNNSIPEMASIYPILRRNGIRSIACMTEYYFYPHRHPILRDGSTERDKALSHANAVCFRTAFSANVYGLKFANAAIMPGPASATLSSTNRGLKSGKTVLAVGRFNDRIKRLDRVLICFKHLLFRHRDANLCVVGPYNLQDRIPSDSDCTIEELMAKLELPAAQIHFAGAQSSTEKYYSQADVFILTSDSEAFGMVLMESASHGLPAVIVNIPGLEDIITDGVNGYIVPQDDAVQMAEKIGDLFEQPDLYRRMSDHAQRMVKRFSTEVIGRRWDDLLQVVLTSRSQAEIDSALSARFFRSMTNHADFGRTIVREFEQTASSIAASRMRINACTPFTGN